MIEPETMERTDPAFATPELTASPLRRYARWQLRDFVRNRAVWLVPLGILAIWIFRANYDLRAFEYMNRVVKPRITEAEYFRQQFNGLLGVAGVLGSLIASFGIVSRDRERGLQRFLFARPVTIWRYYLQAFAVNGAGLLAVAALGLAATAIVFARPVPFGVGLGYVAVCYAVLGGFTFLLSTLVRFDAALAGVLSLLAMPLSALASHAQGFWGAVARVVSWPLPPAAALGALLDPGDPRMAPGTALAISLAYGAAYVSLAVAVLRKRSITT